MSSSHRIYFGFTELELDDEPAHEADIREPSTAKLIEFLPPPSLVTAAKLLGDGFGPLVNAIEARSEI